MDVPAQEEVGHWEDEYMDQEAIWVYQCNGCGTTISALLMNLSHIQTMSGSMNGNLITWQLHHDRRRDRTKIIQERNIWVVDVPAQDEVGHWEYK